MAHRSTTLRALAFPVMALMALALLVFTTAVAFAGSHASPYLTRFHTVGALTPTDPGNGDINPYGVAVVPNSVGDLTVGNVLVSNFNNKGNLQGTGSTIVQVTPSGTMSLFAHIDATKLPTGACPGGVGLTTALGVLQRGWVIVGSLPTADGMATTAQAGCLIVLDSMGNVVETFANTNTITPDINGPWDMTLADNGSTATLYVTNVLNGTVTAGGKVVDEATVIRISLNVPLQGADMPTVQKETVIGSDFPERTDPAALVIGPTGLALSNGTLYVADSLDNRIAAIDNASTPIPGAVRTVVVGGALNDPLGMTLAPNGDLVAVNGNDGKAVEVTQSGAQVAVKVLDNTVTHHGKNGGGTLFGLAPVPSGAGLYFVDDGTNTLNLLH
jgi:hypothetical protein